MHVISSIALPYPLFLQNQKLEVDLKKDDTVVVTCDEAFKVRICTCPYECVHIYNLVYVKTCLHASVCQYINSRAYLCVE